MNVSVWWAMECLWVVAAAWRRGSSGATDMAQIWAATYAWVPAVALVWAYCRLDGMVGRSADRENDWQDLVAAVANAATARPTHPESIAVVVVGCVVDPVNALAYVVAHADADNCRPVAAQRRALKVSHQRHRSLAAAVVAPTVKCCAQIVAEHYYLLYLD